MSIRVGAMDSDKDLSKIEKFDGTNFGYWKMQVEDHLYEKDLYQPLKEKPTEMEQEAWDLLDRKALGAVRKTLSKHIAFNVKKETSTIALMARLSKMYEQPSAANKVRLIKKLFNMKMSEDCNFKEHLNEFNEVTDQLNSVDLVFDDEIRALLILGQLPESWNGTVTAISSSTGKKKLKFDNVVNLIMTEEIRRQADGGSTSGSALNVDSRGRSSNKGNGRGRSKSRNGRSKSKNPRNSNNNQNQNAKKIIECWNCGKTGHYRNQCRSEKKEAYNKNESNVLSEESDDA